ncbi:AI-2E family transporter [Falsirhodobacter xinxiangensis]|uniref:AI-2E family transporter n=1 Tax=Falsirhodobacter xinxiangensis TaxID=2530049 RepID=UPI0010AAA577|nr:AI-2E family transporter [Rhodobacter xinxiangensis]
MERVDRLWRYSLIFLGVFALFAALRIAEGILAPLVLALVAGVVLSPLSDLVERWGMRPVVGALTCLFVTLLLVGIIAAALQPMVARLVEAAPKIWSDMQDAVEIFRRLLSGFSQLTNGLGQSLSSPAEAQTGAGDGLDMAMPSISDALLYAPSVAAQMLIFVGALFFFLLTRVEIYDWAARRLSAPSQRAQTANRLRGAERLVARYFLTITIINMAEALIVTVVLQLLGMPGAPLWGLVVFLLNYLLYIGPAILTVALIFGGVAAFDGGYSLLPAAAYLVVNAIEGQFVTPALIGKHTEVNPLLVFLALVFGMWLWGPVGGIVAIPILLWVLQLHNGQRAARLPPSEA